MHLDRHLLKQAEQQGLLQPEQIEPLWQFLQQATADRPGFRASHLLYYFGGLLAIGAMTLFMTLGWEQFGGGGLIVICLIYAVAGLAVTEHLLGRQLPIPAGICATFVLTLAPLLVYGVQQLCGQWSGELEYRDYHRYIDWRWLMMELATLAAGAVLLWRYRLPFLVMPIAVTLWYMSMDLTPFLFGDEDYDWLLRKWVSVYCGLLIMLLGFWVDIRTRHTRDYAFWLYLFGLAAFWGGLSSMSSDSEWNKFIYLCINLGLLLLGAILSRRAFVVFAAFGICAYLGHLAYDVFEDSLMFPFVLTLLGFAIIGAGLWWQRHEEQLTRRLRALLPQALRELIEHRAS